MQSHKLAPGVMAMYSLITDRLADRLHHRPAAEDMAIINAWIDDGIHEDTIRRAVDHVARYWTTRPAADRIHSLRYLDVAVRETARRPPPDSEAAAVRNEQPRQPRPMHRADLTPVRHTVAHVYRP